MLECHWQDLGPLDYAAAFELQQQLAERRKRGEIPDQLLLLEHPHVITLGRSARREHILNVPPEVEVHETNRGGDVTYHGPGQLVGYPIVDLAAMNKRDVVWYVRSIEEALIAARADFGITGERIPCLTGVWVGGEKIAALGVHLSRWVTCHGFALNVNTDLAYFACIVPCGIRDHGVTSMQKVLGHPVEMEAVKRSVIRSFERIFSLA